MNVLLDSLAPERRAMVGTARDSAAGTDAHPYLVGGLVRDLIRGRPAGDLDLAVEGDAPSFVARLHQRIGGRLRHHERFGTWSLQLPLGEEVDIVTARRETYSYPGALPRIDPSSIGDDLRRRDFTVNAIAIDVITGEVVDPSGGIRDLQARRIRILHARSFIDDPTRLFRAIRFSVRLGFDLEEHTASLFDEAIDAGVTSTVSRERIWREIELGVAEPDPPAVLIRFAEERLLREFLGIQRLDSGGAPLLRRVAEVLPRFEKADRAVVWIAALAMAGSLAPPLNLDGSPLTRRKRDTIERIVRQSPSYARALQRSSPFGAYIRSQRVPEEMLVIAAALDDAVAGIIDRYLDQRNRRASIDVASLPDAPGALLARALLHTRAAIACGSVAATDATSFASTTLLKYLERQTKRRAR